MDTETKWLLAALAVACLLTGWGIKGCAVGCGEGYSEGERVGIVTKLSHKGLIWKSWDGTMSMGAMSPSGKDGAMVPVQFEFTAVDPGHVEALTRALSSGERVRVRYEQWFNSPIQFGSDYIVRDVTTAGAQ